MAIDWTTAAILGGAALGSSALSFFGDDDDDDAKDVAKQQARISGALFKQSQPLRNVTFNTLMATLLGRRPVNFRVFAPEREALEAQYGHVREGILGSTERGGLQERLLTDAMIERAKGVVGLESDVRRNAFAQALGIATGMPQVALQGLSSAGGTYANLAAINQQANQAQGNAIGSLAALTLLGGGFLGGNK